MKKIKITENQYKLIENFLFEVKNKTFDRQLQQRKAAQQKPIPQPKSNDANNITKKLNDLNNEFANLSLDDEFVIQTTNGSFKGIISRKTDSFIDFDMILNNGKSLLDLKSKNNPPFTIEHDEIIFGIVNKQGKAQKITAITNMSINKNQNPLPDEDEEPENNPVAAEPEGTTDQPNEPSDTNPEPTIKRANDIYRTIVNDPKLKDAFWRQPKLFNLIKMGDPVGVGPAADIINKFKTKFQSKHKNNQTIEFEVVEGFNDLLEIGKTYISITRVTDNNEFLLFSVKNKKYKLRILGHDEMNANLINAELSDRNTNLHITEKGVIKYTK